LYLIIQPTGFKSWALRFRRPSGKTAKLTLGPADATDVRSRAGDRCTTDIGGGATTGDGPAPPARQGEGQSSRLNTARSLSAESAVLPPSARRLKISSGNMPCGSNAAGSRSRASWLGVDNGRHRGCSTKYG
jgi:hypothetical protein